MLAKHHIQERVEGPVVSAQLSGLCRADGLCGGAVGGCGCLQRLRCESWRSSFLCRTTLPRSQRSLCRQPVKPSTLVLSVRVVH